MRFSASGSRTGGADAERAHAGSDARPRAGRVPRWHDGRLWFSDWIAGEILALDVNDNSSAVVVSHPSLPLCFDFLPDGSLVLVSNQEHAVLRRDANGTLSRYADLAEISDQLFNDVVGDEHGGRLTAFDIDGDGILGRRRIWAAVDGSAPDGICIDADGAVWYADVPNRRCVRVAEGGTVLDTVELDRGGFACMLGGADGRTLFVVAAQWHGMQAIGRSDVDWDGTVFAFDVTGPERVGPARPGAPLNLVRCARPWFRGHGLLPAWRSAQ